MAERKTCLFRIMANIIQRRRKDTVSGGCQRRENAIHTHSINKTAEEQCGRPISEVSKTDDRGLLKEKRARASAAGCGRLSIFQLEQELPLHWGSYDDHYGL